MSLGRNTYRGWAVLQVGLLLLLLACADQAGRRPRSSPSPFTVADSLRLLEQYQPALLHYRRLRDSLEAVHDTAGWWKAELWLSYGQMRLGHPDSAAAPLARARLLAASDRERTAWTHAVTSNLLSLQGQFDSAVVEAESAHELAGETRDPELQHAVAYALGWVYSSTGRQREAFLADSESVARLKALAGVPRTTLASALNGLGSDYYWLGRYSDAAPGTPSSWIASARRAFRELIAPLEPGDEAEILVIPDGPLAHIPLEVLIPEGDSVPWGSARRFVYGPSASVLLALARAPVSSSWQRTMLAVGNPSAHSTTASEDFRDGRDVDPGPLPYASIEARSISDLFRREGADLLVGRQATVQQWLKLIPARYRYMHFAAHARVHDRRPERTHLVLSNGSLDLAAIRGLRLNATLVTLSACETALGRRVRGEGVIGLPHAFLAAGARGVLVTLWRIGDASAADFMGEFYSEYTRGARLPRRSELSGTSG